MSSKWGIGLKVAAFAAAAISLGLASPAAASPINITAVNTPNTASVDINGSHGVPSANNVDVGQFVISTSNAGTLYAWCVDLFHDIGIGSDHLSFQTAALTTSVQPDGHTSLTQTQINQISYIAWFGDNLLASNPANIDLISAAIQTEIWKIEYGTHVSISLNGSHSERTFFTTEVSYLDSLLPNANSSYTGYLIQDASSRGQCSDSRGRTADCQTLFVANHNRVPEPATLTLFGTALLGFGAWRRRKGN